MRLRDLLTVFDGCIDLFLYNSDSLSKNLYFETFSKFILWHDVNSYLDYKIVLVTPNLNTDSVSILNVFIKEAA